jgi:S-DNA-T family DNA segregation ATPase FtsK/SpoIIIE
VALTQQKLLFHLADLGDYAFFDVPRTRVPRFVPGRAVVAATTQVIQIAFPADLDAAVAAARAAWPGRRPSAVPVGLLPDRLPFRSLESKLDIDRERWWLPLGLSAATLEPIAVQLYEGEHLLIAGPARSGRSTALCAIAEGASASEMSVSLLAVAVRRSPLRLLARATVVTDPTGVASALAELGAGPGLVLIDDADLLDDADGALTALVAAAPADWHVVAAGRADALRRAYGSWAQNVARSRCGVLLAPDHDFDGDLLGVSLPRFDRLSAMPGRGYVVANGIVEGVQLALPDAVSHS